MKLHRIASMAIATALSATSGFAGPNDPPRGSRAIDPRAPDGTLGMALMGAAVNADGFMVRGSGVTNVLKLGSLGTYEVEFDRNLQTCIFTAAVGPAGAGSAFGEVNVALRSGNNNAVFVDTNNSDGASADLPFHLFVFCPR
jgi:hypothetical protein